MHCSVPAHMLSIGCIMAELVRRLCAGDEGVGSMQLEYSTELFTCGVEFAPLRRCKRQLCGRLSQPCSEVPRFQSTPPLRCASSHCFRPVECNWQLHIFKPLSQHTNHTRNHSTTVAGAQAAAVPRRQRVAAAAPHLQADGHAQREHVAGRQPPARLVSRRRRGQDKGRGGRGQGGWFNGD